MISIPAYSGWERLSKMLQDKPWGLCLTVRSKKLQEKPLDVQFNLQEVFGYMLLPKESWLLQLKKPIAVSTHFINLLTLPPSTTAISQENCDILLTTVTTLVGQAFCIIIILLLTQVCHYSTSVFLQAPKCVIQIWQGTHLEYTQNPNSSFPASRVRCPQFQNLCVLHGHIEKHTGRRWWQWHIQ
jgi:hypothetical protein